MDFGPLDRLWSIPQLRRVHVWVADLGQLDLGKMAAPHLRDFGMFSLRWEFCGADLTGGFHEAKWPALERLALRIPETFVYQVPVLDGAYVSIRRYEDLGGTYYREHSDPQDFDWSEELGELLISLSDTELEHLSLTSIASPDCLFDALELGLPPTLTSLDLSGSDIDDEDAVWMVDHRELFEQLHTLDLRDTLIEDPSPLEVLAPKILHSTGDGAVYRYCVGCE